MYDSNSWNNSTLKMPFVCKAMTTNDLQQQKQPNGISFETESN